MFLGKEKWGMPHILPPMGAPLVMFTYVAI